ncbi:MAG: ECF transporter S component [Clostridia bacterium]|nr:ECF transporter S component [Clostridia bacterium]
MEKQNKKSITKLSVIAMLSAVSFALFLLEFPVIPSLGHLKLDFSDIPALIGGIIYGPFAAVVVEFIKNLIELLVKGVGTQMGFGNLMNFIVGCAYVVPFTACYRKFAKNSKTIKAILIGSVLGLVSILIFGFIANYFIAPLFFKYFLGINLTSEGLWTAVWGATAINAIKGVMLSLFSFPVIKVVNDRLKKIMKS